MLGSPYKARGLIVVRTDEIINNQIMVSVSVADPDPGSGAFLTPGSGMGRKSGSGTGIWFFWLKYFNSLMRIRDPGWRQFGSGMEKVGSGIRDKHPGSATLDL
jgi:hypothetical protein